MTYNDKLIEKYKDFDKVIKTYYQAKDHNGKLINLDGIINPLKIDNRQLCAPTDDQGNESSCAAFSIANICESIIWKKTGKLVNLDAHQIYAKAKTLDESPRSDGTYLECAIKAAFMLGGIDVKDLKIRFLYNDGTTQTIEMLKFLVHRHDFVHAGFQITSGWYECNNQNYYISCNGQPLGGHAILIPAYFPDGVCIQNSWSKNWGSMGFGILKWEDFLRTFMYACVIDGINY